MLWQGGQLHTPALCVLRLLPEVSFAEVVFELVGAGDLPATVWLAQHTCTRHASW